MIDFYKLMESLKRSWLIGQFHYHIKIIKRLQIKKKIMKLREIKIRNNRMLPIFKWIKKWWAIQKW